VARLDLPLLADERVERRAAGVLRGLVGGGQELGAVGDGPLQALYLVRQVVPGRERTASGGDGESRWMDDL
jgi:hypothetical protein